MDITKKLFFAQKSLAALFSVTNKLQMQGDKYLQDMTIRQMLAIPALIHAPNGKATINYIAAQMGTTKQNAKQIVDIMERKEYLEVSPNEEDKRALSVAVTSKGHQAFSKCSKLTDEFLADIFIDFTADDLEKFCKFLEKLYSFDGVFRENPKGHADYEPNEASEILKHHQSFVERTAVNEKRKNEAHE